MNTEQKDIVLAMINKMIEGNSILIESLNSLHPYDKLEFTWKVYDQIESTKELVRNLRYSELISDQQQGA